MTASMRFVRCVLVAVLFASYVIGAHVPGHAQSNVDRQNQLKEDIRELSAEEAAAQNQLNAIRARKAEIDARVARLDTDLSDAVAKASAKEAEVARLEIELRNAQARLDETQVRLRAAQEEVRESAAELYRSARHGVAYDYLTVQRPADLVHASKYLDHVNARQQRTMHLIAVLRDELAAQRQAIATSKSEADAAAADAQRTRDDIARMRSEIEPARAEAAAHAAAEAAQVATLAARKREAEQELQAVSAAIAEEIRRASSSSGPVAGSGNPGACDVRPTTGKLTSGFGTRGGRLHAGVDIAAPIGTPIYACWGGRVLIAGWHGGYGNTVVIDHGAGKSTLYAHQSRIAVSIGQTVSAGSVIGYVGSTGHSTGPHLHFEVRINGDPVNPANVL